MKISVQQLANSIVDPAYRQPVKTIEECMRELAWEVVDRPDCCGSPVEVRSFIGSPYFAQCKTCGKFAVDVTGPSFSNGGGCVNLIDAEKVDLDTDKTWICGTQATAN